MANLSLNQNQFAQSAMLGMVTNDPQPETFSCQLNPSSDWTGPITAGQSVMLSDVTGPQIIVEPCAADDDAVFGVIAYNLRKNSYELGDIVSVVGDGGVLLLKSSAAIARGAKVGTTNQTVATDDPTVATQTTAEKAVTGIALEKATAANQLIKVLVRPSVNPAAA